MFSSDFVKGEHRYRMDAMRAQSKQASRRISRTAGAVVVAVLLSAALAACGVPADAGTAVDAGIVVRNRVFHDQAPTWQPNEGLLRKIMSSDVGSTQVVIPVVEFGGMAAPSWEPNYGRLETLLGAEPTSGQQPE
jgi:hypothetical protein